MISPRCPIVWSWSRSVRGVRSRWRPGGEKLLVSDKSELTRKSRVFAVLQQQRIHSCTRMAYCFAAATHCSGAFLLCKTTPRTVRLSITSFQRVVSALTSSTRCLLLLSYSQKYYPTSSSHHGRHTFWSFWYQRSGRVPHSLPSLPRCAHSVYAMLIDIGQDEHDYYWSLKTLLFWTHHWW